MPRRRLPTPRSDNRVSFAHVASKIYRGGGKRLGKDRSTHRTKWMLWREGLLPARAVDGWSGPRLRRAYAAWQRRLGYRGKDADGIPGLSSFRALCRKYGFRIINPGWRPPVARNPVTRRVATPVPGYRITTPFGIRGSRWAAGYHTGDDYAAPRGTPMVAVRAGQIVGRGWSGAYGNRLILRANNGRDYWYAHLSSFIVPIWARVKAGQRIGRVGATGQVTGAHLHHEDRPKFGGYGSGRKPRW